jgi:hypothetical protein
VKGWEKVMERWSDGVMERWVSDEWVMSEWWVEYDGMMSEWVMRKPGVPLKLYNLLKSQMEKLMLMRNMTWKKINHLSTRYKTIILYSVCDFATYPFGGGHNKRKHVGCVMEISRVSCAFLA